MVARGIGIKQDRILTLMEEAAASSRQRTKTEHSHLGQANLMVTYFIGTIKFNNSKY